MNKEREIDLLAMGRVAVDLYAEQIHSSLKDAQTFKKYVGGCAGNIAVGCARLGLKTTLLSKVGDDEMGAYILETLQTEQVDTSFIKKTPDHLTGLVLLGISPPDNFPLMFYREQCADMQLDADDCDIDIWDKTKALLITGTGLSTSSMRQVTLKAISKAKQHGVKVVLDLDYRPTLWGQTVKGNGEDRVAASHHVTKAYQMVLGGCDLIVGTQEEWRVATGAAKDNHIADEIKPLTTKAVCLVKKGAGGCEIYSQEQLDCPGFEVDVLNVLGAGDAFMSGFLSGWLKGKPLKMCAHYANAAGAIVVTRHGCAPAIPYLDELEYFLRQEDSQAAIQSKQLQRLHKPTLAKSKQYIFAFDHRWQFEKQCADKSRIKAFKQALYQGFKQFSQANPKYQEHLGLLIDNEYGHEILKVAQNVEIAVPIEKAGSQTLQWQDDKPLYEQILKRPQPWQVKVLCEYNSGMSDAQLAHQISALSELYQVCVQLERHLILELISLDNVTAMSHCYQAGIYPNTWKITPPKTKWEWEQISDLLDNQDPTARVLILGGADLEISEFDNVFHIANDSPYYHGFAMGRTIFWEAWLSYQQGTLTLEQVSDLVQENLAQLLDLDENVSIQEANDGSMYEQSFT